MVALMKVTVKEIASEAGVSLGSVSRVLNSHPAVKESIRVKVNNAVERLHYQPLRSHGTKQTKHPLKGLNIAILTLSMDKALKELPIVRSTLDGIENHLSVAEANILKIDIPLGLRMPAVIKQKKIDGVIIKAAMQGDILGSIDPEISKWLSEIPAVWCTGKPVGAKGDLVEANEMLVGQYAARQLIQAGHINLAFFNPKPNQILFMKRECGFKFFSESEGAKVHSIHGKLKSDALIIFLPSGLTVNISSISLLPQAINHRFFPPSNRVPGSSSVFSEHLPALTVVILLAPLLVSIKK